MAKETKKQIKAQCINEARQQFAGKIEGLEKEIERLNGVNKRLKEYIVKTDEWKQRALDAEERNQTLMDWIERLQDFTNMSDADREEAIKTFREKVKSEQEMTSLLKMFGTYYGLAMGSAGLY